MCFWGTKHQNWRPEKHMGVASSVSMALVSCLGRGTDFKPRLNSQLDNQFWYQTIKSTVVHELEKIDINPYIAKYNPTSWFWFVVQWFRHQNHTQQNFPRGSSGNQKGTRKIQEVWMVKSCKIWVISMSFPCHCHVISMSFPPIFPANSSDLWPKVSLVTLLCEVGKIIGKSTLHEGFCWENHLPTGRDFPARHGWRHWNVIFQKIIGHRSLTSNPLERFWTSKA